MKLAVFDVDGTLVDSQAQIVASMTAGLAGAGLEPLPPERVLSIVGLSLPLAIATLLPGVDADTRAEVERGYRGSYLDARLRANSPLFPGVADMLARLARHPRLLLAVATGKSRRGLDALIAAHGFEGLFVATECADGHPSKPHPAMLEAALARAGVTRGEAVMIGDTSFDMDMARAAGVPGWGVAWGYHPAADLAAERLFADVPALVDALEQWA